MKFVVKDMDISTGSVPVVLLNKKDALKLDLHKEDRICVKRNEKETTAIVDVAEKQKTVPEGRIGFFEEVIKKLNAKNNDIVSVHIGEKPISVQYIKEKLDGLTLSSEKIEQIVKDIVADRLSDIELSYFVSACYTNSLNIEETKNLTLAMVNSGEILKLKKKIIVDKHCSGGVPGNRTTMVIVPIICAAGLTMPKTSSRSITSPAGTADTMEVLADVSFGIKKMKKIVEKTNGCIVWGGALNLAPADDKIIRVEHPLQVDAEAQLLASIMAKKKSVSATHILIDIPYGKNSKISTINVAFRLKKRFEMIARKVNVKVKVILTDGTKPIGRGIGPSLEAKDVLYILRNDSRAPNDLLEKSLMMAGLLLEIGGKARKGEGKKKATEILASGKAYEKMVEIIKAQNGKEINPDNIPVGKYTFDVIANKNGKFGCVNNAMISKIARIAGAPLDKGAGIYLEKNIGEKVRKGDILFTIYAENKNKLEYAVKILKRGKCYGID